MGKVTWGGGLSADTIDSADRSDIKPYDGPIPPNGLYAFKVKILRKSFSKQNNPQLMIGLELVPRQTRPDDRPFEGYWITDFIPVMESTASRLASFLDAIGVKGADFMNRTADDGSEKKNIVRIGRVEPVGKFVMVNLTDGTDQKGNPRKEVAFGGYYAPPAGGKVTASSQDSDDDGAGDDDAPPF